MNKIKVCMIVQDKMVKGGIAAVTSGYYGSRLEQDFDLIYIESYKDGGKLTKLFKGIKAYLIYLKVLLIDKPDLIHIHSSFGASFYRKLPFIYLAFLANKPIINHIHGADFENFFTDASIMKKRLIKKAYNKCTVLIALSSEWKNRLSQIVPANKIEIIENYSVLHEDALKARMKRKCNNTVLFLGELGKRKGCYDIPKVLKKLVKYNPSVKFVLGGSGDNEDEKLLKRIFSDYGISKNVSFPGWVRGSIKDKLLKEADVFFLPSYNEGMPMSVLEAMGYGLPIVSTNVGGIPKLVHDGENGTCCDPGDINNFQNGIKKILNDTPYRNRCSKCSFQIVASRYSFDIHLKHLEDLYNTVFNKYCLGENND